MKHETTRTKVIPNDVFDELWNSALIYTDCDLYIDAYTNPTNISYVNYKGYGISYMDFCKALKELYRLCHLSMKEVIDLTGESKAALSHIFCIPKRTIENWYYGDRECAGYFRLMILRQFHLIRLGKYITVEAEQKYLETVPRIYESHEKKKSADSKPSFDEFVDSLFEDDEDDIGNIVSDKKFLDEGEVNETYSNISDLLKDTDYLRRKPKGNGWL